MVHYYYIRVSFLGRVAKVRTLVFAWCKLHGVEIVEPQAVHGLQWWHRWLFPTIEFYVRGSQSDVNRLHQFLEAQRLVLWCYWYAY